MPMHLKPPKRTAAARPAGLPQRPPPIARAQQHWQRGVGLAEAGDWPAAAAAFQSAVEADPGDRVARLNLARAQLKADRLDEAAASAGALLAADARNTIARSIAAECLTRQYRYSEAADCLLQQPADVERSNDFHHALTQALFNAGRHQEAVAALFDALRGDITHAMSHYRLGLSLNALGMKAEATECLRTAILAGMGPGEIAAQGLLTFIERELCRWNHATADLAALCRLAAELPPDAARWTAVFAQVTLTEDPAVQLRVARSCVRFNTRAIQPLPAQAPRPLPPRLRVGFLSADFHQHATAVLMAEVFELLDRERFSIHLYSHGPDDGSPMRVRLRQACDAFVDIAALSDQEAAVRIRGDNCDLLVEMKGHTRDTRIDILAYRPAPVQASFLGFPGSTGADFVDYFIGDAIVSPITDAPHYTEKLALMPRCYQPNDRQRPLPAPMARSAVGLPEDALVLCGFNQPFKLSPEVFDAWCGLLQQLPGSVLWLLQWNATAPAQLRAEAAARGIAPERLVFAPKIGLAGHLSRFALADIYLDSWPCNGHTTVSDALWAGVPVVTCTGGSFASRVAASLLAAVGLPELACDSVEAYQRQVLALAADPAHRQRLRAQLVQARSSAPLFDSAGYSRDFGELLQAMAERWSQGLPPAHLIPAAIPCRPSDVAPVAPPEQEVTRS